MEKIGLEKLKLICINPDEKYVLTYLREFEQEGFNYTYFKKDEWFELHLYFENTSSNIYKNVIRVENKPHNNYWINQIADYQYVKDESQLFESFKIFQKGLDWNDVLKRYENYENIGNKLYRQAYIGEIQLLSFLRSYLDKDTYDINTNYFIDLSKLFNGHFLEITKLLKSQKPFDVIGLLQYNNGIIELNNRLLPIYMYYLSSYKGIYKKIYTELKSSLKKIDSTYYYILDKSILFNLSMIPKKKEILPNHAIY